MDNKTPVIEFFIGSISDKDSIMKALNLFDTYNIAYNCYIASAHRTPNFVIEKAKTAKKRNIKVIIAAAGGSAHLAGVIAAHTIIPVIGLPLSTNILNGIDSLLSTMQMPSGIPVATVAIDGQINAALLALQILAIENEDISNLLIKYREDLSQTVLNLNN